jgi:6-pyruvoyltetrahydropterin/6-carboxytetrahydropterin synthase
VKAHISKAIFFEAARRLPQGPGKPPRLTGYSYKVELLAGGEVDPERGWVADYADLKALFEPARVQLDHRCLDDVPGLAGKTHPADIADWIEDQLRPWPAWFQGVRVSVLGDGAFDPVLLPPDSFERLPSRWSFSFAAAQSLPQLPPSHPCHNLHGHTYQVEIAAVDLDGLPPIIKKLHSRLHDTLVNDIPGLEQATCERLCAWVWRFMADRGARPTLVAMQETPNNRCLYFGE